MSSTQVNTERQPATGVPTAVDLKLEVIAIPVSDVDRAKAFYGGLGWTLDADFMVGKDFRAVHSHRPDRHARSICPPQPCRALLRECSSSWPTSRQRATSSSGAESM